VPAELSALAQLRVLHLPNNDLGTARLPSWPQLQQLRPLAFLSLSHCSLRALPPAVQSMTSLQVGWVLGVGPGVIALWALDIGPSCACPAPMAARWSQQFGLGWCSLLHLRPCCGLPAWRGARLGLCLL
jgi:hypothetical protein